MTLLEKLKELSAQATPGPCRVVTLEFDEESGDIRYVVEFPGVKTGSVPEARRLEAGINALPALIAVAEAAVEVADVARLREDDVLPKPEDDPKLWTARMQTAWNELDKHIAALEVEA